jgi:hypothetical protein
MMRAVLSRLLGAFTVIAAGTVILLPSMAVAEEACAPSDAVCVVETLPSGSTEPAERVAGSVTDTVDRAGDEPDRLLGRVVAVVDDVLGDGAVVDPPGSGGTGEDPGDPSGPSRSTSDPGAGPTATIRESVAPVRTVISAASGARPVPRHRSPGSVGGIIEEAVRSLVLLLVFLGFAVGFVLLQDRVDRNDPRLGAAPARADLITFV